MRIEDLVQAALREDMPAGDVTTESLGLGPRRGFARLRAKQDLVLSGTEPFEIAMKLLEPGCRVTWHFDQGQMALRGQNLCTIEGDLM
ncbi:MAG: nicotinate-nucleotide diphosphorylase (carboxylating), partial [Bdellovibrionaceae bacterium]|nr:nicotinate-nucleotide diphosphorylase (carboxylating) [Pseudobdellovibrionaceae bacterium]